jgi:hypothetical protein
VVRVKIKEELLVKTRKKFWKATKEENARKSTKKYLDLSSDLLSHYLKSQGQGK